MTGHRADGVERRTELLTSALALALDVGFSALTTRGVAEAAGVSRGLAFHYFATRDELVAETFRHAAEQELDAVRAATDSIDDPIERLWRFIALYAPPSRQGNTSFLLWVDAWSEALRNPTLAKVLRSTNRAWAAMIAGILEAGRASGAFECADPATAAWRIMSSIDGLAVQTTVNRAFPSAQVQRWARQSCVELLGLDPSGLDRVVQTTVGRRVGKPRRTSTSPIRSTKLSK
jgi:AcrR family transcriptional regulator